MLGLQPSTIQGNNDVISIENDKTIYSQPDNSNISVLKQSDALLIDDPLLSFSNLNKNISKQLDKNFIKSEHHDLDTDFLTESDYRTIGLNNFVCKWEECYKNCDSQMLLVKHIEKYHVEIKRGK